MLFACSDLINYLVVGYKHICMYVCMPCGSIHLSISRWMDGWTYLPRDTTKEGLADRSIRTALHCIFLLGTYIGYNPFPLATFTHAHPTC